MDWKRAIEINREALTRIVAGLVALLGLQQGVAKRLPLPVYHMIARILHPAESAVRRLIVIAARGLVVPLLPARPMPQGRVIAGKGSGRIAFQLFDTRKRFSDTPDAPPMSGPRIRFIGDPDPRSLFLAKFVRPADGLSSAASTLHLGRRVAAVKTALANLPSQAKRLVRWRARRTMMQSPKFVSPLRPGPPPGHRKEPREEIDHVLRECHALAWDALSCDTS